MSDNILQCQRFCALALSKDDISNATARIGVWLMGVNLLFDGNPFMLTYRQIRDGFELGSKQISGTGSHIETVKKSIDWLEDNGVISTKQGKRIGFGHYSRLYSVII